MLNITSIYSSVKFSAYTMPRHKINRHVRKRKKTRINNVANARTNYVRPRVNLNIENQDATVNINNRRRRELELLVGANRDPQGLEQGIDQQGIDQQGIDQQGIDQPLDQQGIDQQGIDQPPQLDQHVEPVPPANPFILYDQLLMDINRTFAPNIAGTLKLLGFV